jgi:subtilase family serine protease
MKMSTVTKKQMVLGALCGGLLCSCSEPLDALFPGSFEPIADIDCGDGIAAPPIPLGVIDGWSIDAGWESRVVCEHRHSHSYVDVSIPGNLCLGLNRGVGAMAAHPPVADGPGTYIVSFAALVENDQRIEVAVSRGTDSESPDWARSVSVGLECFRPCEAATQARPRLCRPFVRFHDTPKLKLETGLEHERYEAMPGHSAQDYELKCALREEHGFPLPTTGTITAEIAVEGRSIGWKIDGARVSGFGPSYQLERSRWSCERTDGTPVEKAQRLFVVGLPFGEAAQSPDQPGYELVFEHWSPDERLCSGGSSSARESDSAWMCVRDARYAACSEADCPEACGDGACDTWETCSTCQSDCGICGSTPIAELGVESIECGHSFNNGGPVSCDIVLVNKGTASAGEFDNQLRLSHDETFSSADALLGSCTSNALEAGSTSTITCNGTVPFATEAGTWYLGLIADSSDAVAELDESNNLRSKAITVVSDYVSPTDLVISSVDCISPAVGTGEEVECFVTVKNVGGLDAGPFLVDLLLSKDEIIDASDTLLDTCEVLGVGAGSSLTIICTGTVPLGTLVGSRYLGVMADSHGEVLESDKSNNTGYDSSSILINAGPPDLVVSSVSCPPNATSPGPISCSVTMKNGGDSVANFVKNEMRLSSDTYISSADTLLGSCEVTFVSPGQSKTFMCSGSIPAGQTGFTKYVGILADSQSFISELDESNNTGYDSVSIQQGPADLVVSSVSCPASATSPGAISCSASIKNQGTGNASLFSSVMRLSDNTTIDSFDTQLGSCDVSFGLSPGQSQTITCSGSIPPGKSGVKYVIVTADSTLQVSESNEGNNTGSDSVSIQ